jgi:hypothetical protein
VTRSAAERDALLRALEAMPNRILDEFQLDAGISYGGGHNARMRRVMKKLLGGEAINLGKPWDSRIVKPH